MKTYTYAYGKRTYIPVSELTEEQLAIRREKQRKYFKAHYRHTKVAKLSVPVAKPAPKAKSPKTWKLVSEMTEEQRLKKNAYQRKWYYAHWDAEQARGARYQARQKVIRAEKTAEALKAALAKLPGEAKANIVSGLISAIVS